jgi:hypothetical protein
MSSTNLEVVFEGPAVKAGTIDARLLSDSLAGYSEVFARANSIINGEASEAAVLVVSNFKHGSFVAGLQLVQNIVEQSQQLITAHNFFDAAGLSAVIGFAWKNRDAVKDSLIDLYKWLKGGKPDKAVQIGNNTEITLGQNKKTVSTIIYNLYGDAAIRTALGKLTSPLRHAAIDRIATKQDGIEQNVIEKAEAEFFEPEPLQLESSASPMEGQRETVLIVTKVSFVEGTTWSFIEKGATLTAKIEDEDFWSRVHQHTLVFGEGDSLRVLLHWKVVQSRSKKLMPKNTIDKVYEVLVRPKQMRLDGGKDDDAVLLPGKQFAE